MLESRALRPSTQTVSVYTRHKRECQYTGQPHFRRCSCHKYLYLLKDGKSQTISAKSRSWAVAEEKAAAIRDSWDPVKQKLKELDDLTKAKDLEAMTIEAALDRWLATIRGKHDNNATLAKYTTIAKQIESWARSKGLSKVKTSRRIILTRGSVPGAPRLTVLKTESARPQRPVA